MPPNQPKNTIENGSPSHAETLYANLNLNGKLPGERRDSTWRMQRSNRSQAGPREHRGRPDYEARYEARKTEIRRR